MLCFLNIQAVANIRVADSLLKISGDTLWKLGVYLALISGLTIFSNTDKVHSGSEKTISSYKKVTSEY